MNLSKDKVTEIFYFADNFCKEFYKAIEIYAFEEGGKARREPRRKPKMSSGEVVTSGHRHKILEAQIFVKCSPTNAVAISLIVLQCSSRGLTQPRIVGNTLAQLLAAVGQYVYIVAINPNLAYIHCHNSSSFSLFAEKLVPLLYDDFTVLLDDHLGHL